MLCILTQQLEHSWVFLRYSPSTGTLHVAATVSPKIKAGVGQGTINLQRSFHKVYMLH